jgi:hypothetical protein
MGKKQSARRKKKAKAPAQTPGDNARTGQLPLRKQLANVLRRTMKVSSRYKRRFSHRAEHDPTMKDWAAIKTELQDFDATTGLLLKQYHRVQSRIGASGDSDLIEKGQRIDESGFGSLLEDFNASLADQARRALAPLNDDDRRHFWQQIQTRTNIASTLNQLAKGLLEEIEAPGPSVATHEAAAITSMRTTFGEVIRAGIAFAMSTRHDARDTSLARMIRVNEAKEAYDTALDRAHSNLQVAAKALKQGGRPDLEKKARTFADRLKDEIILEAATYDHVIDVMSAAMVLPQEADSLALKLQHLVRRVRSQQTTLFTACVAADTGHAGRGDHISPESIREYDTLSPSERVVVDLFRQHANEQGPLATLPTSTVITKVGTALKSRELPCSSGTIRTILKKLGDDGILLSTDGRQARVGGHGGEFSYRLTLPAGQKFLPWDATAVACSGVPTGDAAGTGP